MADVLWMLGVLALLIIPVGLLIGVALFALATPVLLFASALARVYQGVRRNLAAGFHLKSVNR